MLPLQSTLPPCTGQLRGKQGAAAPAFGTTDVHTSGSHLKATSSIALSPWRNAMACETSTSRAPGGSITTRNFSEALWIRLARN